jgi:hypothetical protein
MILLAGSPDDGPMGCVIAALERAGAGYVLCDQSQPMLEARLRGAEGRLSGWLGLQGGLRVDLAAVRAVYARLLDHRRFAAHAALQPTAKAAADSAQAVLSGFLDLTDALVVNRTAAMGTNRSKPYQIGLIRRMGFDVPPTLITNDPDRARAFRAAHGRVIFKSASAVRSIVTELDDAALARLSAIRACPVQFQALVPGLDVRVHVVGAQCFATACESPVIDYRYSGGTAQLTPFDLPSDLAGRCAAMAQALDLPVAGIDLKHRPDDGWTCFEVNPSPGFSWFEQATGQPISDAIAQLLIAA